MTIQRLMPGFRLRGGARDIGDIGGNEPQHENSKLLVVLAFSRFGPCVNLPPPQAATFAGGRGGVLIVESVYTCYPKSYSRPTPHIMTRQSAALVCI